MTTSTFKIYLNSHYEYPQVCVDINSTHITFDDESCYTLKGWLSLCDIVINDTDEKFRVDGGGNSGCELTFLSNILKCKFNISGGGGDATIEAVHLVTEKDRSEFVKFKQQLQENAYKYSDDYLDTL